MHAYQDSGGAAIAEIEARGRAFKEENGVIS